jgi:hypothetical protein
MATITSTHAPSATLGRLLDEELAFSPSFLQYFSNHLAMSLMALQQLGAAPELLQSTFDAHAANPDAEPRDDVEDLTRRLAEVERDGIATTVRTRVPQLADAPATALFHPLIRLGYALDIGHAGQVAAALLDWERRREPTIALDLAAGSRRLPDVAAALADQPAGTWTPTFDLDAIGHHPGMVAALHGVALDQLTLDDVSAFALAAHVASDHFITLHLMTGARALRTVAAHLNDETSQRLAHHALPTMAIGYAAAGAAPLLRTDELTTIRRSALPSQAQVAERATADHDPHVIKLAEVALAEERRSDDPLYRYVAARVVGLVR